MKKLIMLSILLCLFLCGCTHELPLQHPTDNISKIELINEEKDGVICTLTGADIPRFMSDLLMKECKKNLEPHGKIGYPQIHIYYENGDVDIIGRHGNARITDGEYILSGWYNFSEADLLELFDAYIE